MQQWKGYLRMKKIEVEDNFQGTIMIQSGKIDIRQEYRTPGVEVSTGHKHSRFEPGDQIIFCENSGFFCMKLKGDRGIILEEEEIPGFYLVWNVEKKIILKNISEVILTT